VPGKIIADHCSVPIYPLKISRTPHALIVNETDVARKYREAPEVPTSLNFALNGTMRVLVVDESINTGASVIAAAKLLTSFGVTAEFLRIAAIADVQAPKIADFFFMETDAKWFGGHFCSANVDSDYVSWMAVHFPDIPVTLKKKFR
jgi:hypoxanthine phosphoribosyltransferase